MFPPLALLFPNGSHRKGPTNPPFLVVHNFVVPCALRHLPPAIPHDHLFFQLPQYTRRNTFYARVHTPPHFPSHSLSLSHFVSFASVFPGPDGRSFPKHPHVLLTPCPSRHHATRTVRSFCISLQSKNNLLILFVVLVLCMYIYFRVDNIFIVLSQDLTSQNSNDSNCGTGNGGTPLRPSPSPTGSTGSRSMSPAVTAPSVGPPQQQQQQQQQNIPMPPRPPSSQQPDPGQTPPNNRMSHSPMGPQQGYQQLPSPQPPGGMTHMAAPAPGGPGNPYKMPGPYGPSPPVSTHSGGYPGQQQPPPSPMGSYPQQPPGIILTIGGYCPLMYYLFANFLL